MVEEGVDRIVSHFKNKKRATQKLKVTLLDKGSHITKSILSDTQDKTMNNDSE